MGCESLTAVRSTVLRSTGAIAAGPCLAKLSKLATSDLVRRTCCPIFAAISCCSGLREVFSEQIGITQHGGDGVVQFVGRAAHQLADRGQFFGFHDLRLQTLQVGEGLSRLREKAEQFAIEQTLAHENHDAHEKRGAKSEDQPERTDAGRDGRFQ